MAKHLTPTKHLAPTPNPSPQGGGELGADASDPPSPLRAGVRSGGVVPKAWER